MPPSCFIFLSLTFLVLFCPKFFEMHWCQNCFKLKVTFCFVFLKTTLKHLKCLQCSIVYKACVGDFANHCFLLFFVIFFIFIFLILFFHILNNIKFFRIMFHILVCLSDENTLLQLKQNNSIHMLRQSLAKKT